MQNTQELQTLQTGNSLPASWKALEAAEGSGKLQRTTKTTNIIKTTKNYKSSDCDLLASMLQL